MRLRVSLIVAGFLAALILLPVAAIVALGVYGGSQGGQASGSSASGASVTLLPASGEPGSLVTIVGEGWQPREPVRLALVTGDGEGRPQLDVSLGSVQASRSGQFDASLVIPPLPFGGGGTSAFIEARGDAAGQSGNASAPYQVEAYATRLALVVLDSPGKTPISGTRVTARDRFGRIATTLTTNSDGRATFVGLAPGQTELAIRAFGYHPANLKTTVVALGDVEGEDQSPVEMALTPSPGLRLAIPHPDSPGGGLLTYVEFDPVAAIAAPVTPTLTLETGWIVDMPDPGIRQHFILPTENGPASELPTILSVANRTRGFENSSQPARLVFVGANDQTAAVFATDDSYWRTQSLFIIDRADNSLVRRVPFGPEELDPIMSLDRRQVYVVDWFMREIDVIDAYTGRRIKTHTGLPRFTRAAILSSDGKQIYLVSALDDELRIFNFDDGQVERTFIKMVGVTTMWLSRDGNQLYGGSYFAPEIVRADLTQPAAIELAPLAEPSEWIWSAPESGYILLGSRGGRSVQVLDADSLQLLAVEQLPEAHSPDPESFGSRLLRPS